MSSRSPNTTRLAGRTALVTGSTGGLGAAFATALASTELPSSSPAATLPSGRGIVDRIESGGGSAAFVAADLGAGGAHVRRLADEATASAGGRIDILVNNAAMLITPTPTADVPEQLVRDAFAVNVSAAFLLTGVIAPTMAEHGAGSIINIGSINGLIGMGGSALYSASKAAIHSLTKSWADEYGPRGVRVNTAGARPEPRPNATRSSPNTWFRCWRAFRPGGPAPSPRLPRRSCSRRATTRRTSPGRDAVGGRRLVGV